jgi:hypothetical protein
VFGFIAEPASHIFQAQRYPRSDLRELKYEA